MGGPSLYVFELTAANNREFVVGVVMYTVSGAAIAARRAYPSITDAVYVYKAPVSQGTPQGVLFVSDYLREVV